MDLIHHNVVIFGAGASADAGVPMLGSFVDKMWELATRGKTGQASVGEEDRKILVAADEIRGQLETYSSRAYFDNRNLEDILSLLSFEALSNEAAAEKYQLMVRAVARTIELMCRFPYTPTTPRQVPPRNIYNELWQALLDSKVRTALPALLTFNYDLVLERTLWEHFHYHDGDNGQPNVASCGLRYNLGWNHCLFKSVPHQYAGGRIGGGYKAEFLDKDKATADLEIPYFKLHGSLNWNREVPLQRPKTVPTSVVENPLILPPVFNKMTNPDIGIVWQNALQSLRSAKHIIIVGYSLPRTDIYMQYFLKSAVGPNRNLQWIFVFDPVLHKGNSESEEMKRRYQECFSPQFSNRIIFTPPLSGAHSTIRGTLRHFVNCLRDAPDQLLFQP